MILYIKGIIYCIIGMFRCIKSIFKDTKTRTYQAKGRVYKGIADENQGYFRLGRTWNFSLRYNF